MKKEIQTQGIVLKIYPVGENAQKVVLLSEEGLLNFISHGTQKSSKKGKIFTLLWARFHLSEKKGEWTLLEIEKPYLLENLSTEIPKFYTASTLAEVALRSYWGVDLFPLFTESLEALDKADSSLTLYLLIQFWWRWIALNGEQFDLQFCSLCERELKEIHFFAYAGEGFLCCECAKRYPPQEIYSFDQGIKRYLTTSEQGTIEASLRLRLSAPALKSLVSYLCQKIENILKWKLKSWEAGRSFIVPPSFKSDF